MYVYIPLVPTLAWLSTPAGLNSPVWQALCEAVLTLTQTLPLPLTLFVWQALCEAVAMRQGERTAQVS